MTPTPNTLQSTPVQPPTRRHRCGGFGSALGGWSGGWYIAATVAGFVVFWPVGLAMLAWAFWHREIRSSSLWRTLRGTRVSAPNLGSLVNRRPNNAALAAYLEREQQRLREEQGKLDELVRAFEAFKEAERKSNDQREFDNFLRQRANGGDDSGVPPR